MFHLLYLIQFVAISSQAVVKWLPDATFSLPINFKNGQLPCSKRTVIFPEQLSGSVRIDRATNADSFVMPADGAIALAGTVTLGADEYDANCTAMDVYYIDNTISSWIQADVWSSARFNKATPDAERVPCYDDAAVFPANAQTTVVLPRSAQRVRYVQVGGQRFAGSQRFYEYVASGGGGGVQFVLNDYYGTGVVAEDRRCRARSGCPCQENALSVDCSLKACSAPTCLRPVKPEGHCCAVCGGFVTFEISESFDVTEFNELVAEAVAGYGGDVLEYHIGRLPRNRVQLVIVDKYDYLGGSAQVLNEIDHSMRGHWVQGTKNAQFSGSPLSKSGMGGKIFVSVFFAVMFSIGTIYVYYYKIPDVMYNIVGRGLPGSLTRIQRRSDSVVSLTRRDSIVTTTGVRTAFRNPLYDSRRGRVQVEELITPQ